MKISVIIPVYNEEDVIGECLESLSRQTLRDFEVIVVDDGSTDKSMEVVNSLKIKNFKLKILLQKHGGAGAARNLGVGKAGGKILVFVDADMTFDENFLTNLTKPIGQGKTKGTFSKEEYVSNWGNVWARAWNVNQNWPARRRHPKNFGRRQKVFRAIKRDEFDRVGGFSGGGYTDDYSLSDKLGYLAVEAKGAKFYHKNPARLSEVFAQAKWSAKRRYKLGAIGAIAALVRASLVSSFVVGVIKAVRHGMPQFLIFRIIYNLGATLGILEYHLLGKGYK